MKLRFKHSTLPLEEAGDINKGHRLKYVQAYCEALSTCLQANNYKLKLHSDKISGFEILPIFNYLVAFKLILAKDNSVDMRIYRCVDDLSKLNVTTIELGQVRSNAEITDVVAKLETVVKNQWDKLTLSSKYLTENYTNPYLSEANIFTNIKNAIDMHAAKKDQETKEKQAEKDAATMANTILKPLCEKLEAIIKNIGAKYNTTSEANNMEFSVFVQAPYVASVNFQADITDPKKVGVKSLLGSDQKIVIQNESLAAVTRLLIKKLALVNNQASLAEFLKNSGTAGDTSSDSASKPDASDAASKDDIVNNYMIPQIAGGVKSLDRAKIKALLGENAERIPQHDWITEDLISIKLKNNVKSNNYMEVYRDIDRTSKNGQLAINALVMRFINKAFGIPSNKVEKLVEDSKSFLTYRDALIAAQFNPADISNPVLYILSSYLIRTQKLISNIVEDVRRFFSDPAVSQLAEKATKNKDHINSESIFYMSDLATVGIPFDLFTCYYLLETPTYSNILTKCTQDSDIRSSIAHILNVEPESLADTDVEDLKHHILYSGDHVRKSKDIKAIVSNLSKLKNVGKSSTSYTGFADDEEEAVAVEVGPDDVKAALKDDTRSSPIELKSFINALALELKSKKTALSEDDLLALQKRLFKAFNVDSE